jgi:hypothetical protein
MVPRRSARARSYRRPTGMKYLRRCAGRPARSKGCKSLTTKK